MDSPGEWLVVGHTGVLGTHASLLHTGQVLFFTRPETPAHRLGTQLNGLPGDDQHQPADPDVTLAALFALADPQAPASYQATPMPLEHNPFCAGHTPLADGRILVAGGDKRGNVPGEEYPFGRAPLYTRYGTNRLRAFTPGASSPWQNLGKITDSRWYPTCTLLADGRVFIIAGSIDDMTEYNTQNPTCELIPPLPSGPQYLHFLAEAWPYHSYPFVYLLPSGHLFVFVKDRAYYLQAAPGYQPWEVATGPQLPAGGDQLEEPAKQYPNSATAVLLPLRPERGYEAEVLLMGGGGANVYTHWDTTAEAVDLEAGGPEDTKWLTYQEISDKFGLPAAEVAATAAARRWHTQQENGVPKIAVQKTYLIPALAHCFRLKVYPQPEAAWRRAAPLHQGRVMLDAVLLPDGKVLVINGTSRGFPGGYPATGPMSAAYAVRAAELYDPEHDTWQVLAEATCSRLYHSTALLLPDARVLVAGSDHQVHQRELKAINEQRQKDNQPFIKSTDAEGQAYQAEAFEYRAEIFSPPYLSRGPRPVVEAAPVRLVYGERFEVAVRDLSALAFDKLQAALLRPGSVTHGNNMSQRYIGLEAVAVTATHLTLQAPPTGEVAPPGYYMLFVLYNGIPAHAHFVQLCLAPAAGSDADSVPRIGLAAWFRADLGVLTDSSAMVNSWADLSGRGNHVFWHSRPKAGQPERPPQWLAHGIHDQPSVRFSLISNPLTDALDPQGGCLQSEGCFLPGTGPYTILTVAHPWPGGGVRNAGRSPKGVGGLLGWGDYAAQGNLPAVVALSLGPGPELQNLPARPGLASLVTYWQRDCNPNQPALQLGDEQQTPVSRQRASLLVSAFDGTDWWARVNGQPVHGPQLAPPKDTGHGPLTIGRTGVLSRTPNAVEQENGEFFRGDIAEVLIYDRALLKAELTALEAYLSTRYGLG